MIAAVVSPVYGIYRVLIAAVVSPVDGILCAGCHCAGIWSHLGATWLWPLLEAASTAPLNPEMIWKTEHPAKAHGVRAQELWQAQPKQSIVWVVWSLDKQTFKWSLAAHLVLVSARMLPSSLILALILALSLDHSSPDSGPFDWTSRVVPLHDSNPPWF